MSMFPHSQTQSFKNNRAIPAEFSATPSILEHIDAIEQEKREKATDTANEFTRAPISSLYSRLEDISLETEDNRVFSESTQEAIFDSGLTDEKKLCAFHERLRDGQIIVRLHNISGKPLKGSLKLMDDKITLLWTNTNRIRFFQHKQQILHLDQVFHLLRGRQTSNFVRTVKYYEKAELFVSDDCCLSLLYFYSASTPNRLNSFGNLFHRIKRQSKLAILPIAPTAINSMDHRIQGSLYTFDLEFLDSSTRNLAFSYFTQKIAACGLKRFDLDKSQAIEMPNGLSTLCYQLIQHRYLERSILALVLLYTLSIATDPLNSLVSSRTVAVEIALLVVLTLQQIGRMIALEGVSHIFERPNTVVSFFSTLLCYFVLLLPLDDSNTRLTGARLSFLTLHIFPCMQSVCKWRHFQDVMDTFMSAIPMALNALLCYSYYLFLFAILGMYVFDDALMYRCAVPLSSAGAAEDNASFYAKDAGSGFMLSSPMRFCRPASLHKPSFNCDSSMECIAMKPPNNGYTGFHSFQSSFLTVFLISIRSGLGSTLDGALQATTFLSILYFIAIIVFVSYMLLSLFVGIMRASYIRASVQRQQREKSAELQLLRYAQKKRLEFPELKLELRVSFNSFRKVRIALKQFEYATMSAVSSVLTEFGNLGLPLSRDRVFFVLEPDGEWVQRSIKIVDSVYLEHCMNTIVLFNSIIIAMEYHGMPETFAAKIHRLETFCMCIYSIEFVLICVSCRGILYYWKNSYNQLDGVLLFIALAESSLSSQFNNTSHPMFVFRLFRLIRFFRVLRKNKQFVQVLNVFFSSVPPYLSLIAVHFLISSAYAVMGIQLFGGKFPSAYRHANFDSYWDAMLTLFKWTCGGSTWQIFFSALSATSFLCAFIYFLSYFIAVVCLLLNYMIVVFLRGFAMTDDEKRTTLSEQFQQRLLEMQQVHHFDEKSFLQAFSDLYPNEIIYATLSGSLAKKKLDMAQSAKEELKYRIWTILSVISPVREEIAVPMRGRVLPLRASCDLGQPFNSITSQETKRDPQVQSDRRGFVWFFWALQTLCNKLSSMYRKTCNGDWLTSDTSLFLFPPQSRFRLHCKRLEKESDKFVFTVIIIRTALLTLQSPAYSNLIQEFTTLVEIFFATVLFFEFSIKVISRGFLFTPRSYLSNPMNQLNAFVLLACSLLLLLPHSTMVSIFKLGRALGPVRVFYRVKTFRVITEALKQSTKEIVCCVIIAFFLFYAFAIIGIQFFAGKFSFCNDASITRFEDCQGFYVASGVSNTQTSSNAGILVPRVWGNLVGLHFDHFGAALAAVLVIVTKKGWLPVLNLAFDIVEGNIEQSTQQIQHIASAYLAALFFVFMILFTRFYLLKVFAGIIMNNFRCHNGTLLLTNAQLIWLRQKQNILSLQPKYPLPENQILQRAHFHVQSRAFRVFMSIIVLLHTFLLAYYHTSGSALAEQHVLYSVHYIFSTVYALDAIMHVVSMGWKDFLMSGFTWRTTNSVTAFIMLFGPLFSNSRLILILGITRAFDFKYISLVFEKFDRLKLLFETLLCSTRLILKVTLLLGYVLFIFATFGMQLFALTKWNYGLDASLNFLTFPSAFTAFVKFAAGEDWYDTHMACSVDLPKCSMSYRAVSAKPSIAFRNASANAGLEEEEKVINTLLFNEYISSDCGSAALSTFFYYTFYVLVVLILQNLYVATMVDTYVSTFAVHQSLDKSGDQGHPLLGFGADQLKIYQRVWSEFDQQALGFIHRKHLHAFVLRLPRPLGAGNEESGDAQDRDLQSWIRREIYEDIDARLAELTFRLRRTQDHSGGDFTCPVSVIRFSDLLLVSVQRIVPVECLTVREKVDELAIRGYVLKYRAAIRVQAAFRMYHVLSRHIRAQRRKCPSRIVIHTTPVQKPEHRLACQINNTLLETETSSSVTL